MKRHLLILSAILVFYSCHEREGKTSAVDERQAGVSKIETAINDSTACIFSEIAYCSNPQQQLDKYMPGWKVVWNPLPVSGIYAFVATDSNRYLIAIRGSLISFTEDAFNNWITNDLNVTTQNAWPYSKTEKAAVSHGAYLGWQSLDRMRDRKTGKSLWSYLSEAVTDQKPLVVTGHSLGGNLATVYGSYISSKFEQAGHPKNNINVITFAAPAPGNSAFAADFNAKFPMSERIENTNDIVPKFPCSHKIAELSDLYLPLPAASAISVGYNNMTTKLDNVFTLMGTSLAVLEMRDGFTGYEHTNGHGKLITISLSGKDTLNTANAWFSEAGYQHGVAQYATYFNAPVIKSE